MCRLSWNLGASTSWNPQGLSRSVMGLLYRTVSRADNLTTFMCRLSWNLGASTSWNPQGLSRSVMGFLYLFFFFSRQFYRNLYTHTLMKIMRKTRSLNGTNACSSFVETEGKSPQQNRTCPISFTNKVTTSTQTLDNLASRQTHPGTTRQQRGSTADLQADSNVKTINFVSRANPHPSLTDPWGGEKPGITVIGVASTTCDDTIGLSVLPGAQDSTHFTNVGMRATQLPMQSIPLYHCSFQTAKRRRCEIEHYSSSSVEVREKKKGEAIFESPPHMPSCYVHALPFKYAASATRWLLLPPSRE
jgi:hypothetical protein